MFNYKNVVSIAERKVIWNHDARGKATLNKFYHKIGKKGCKKAEAVVSDGLIELTTSKAISDKARPLLFHLTPLAIL
jgi:hypothetical protein